MNGSLLKWLPLALALIAAAGSWGAMDARQSAMADRLKGHEQRPAHESAREELTTLKAASERIDERTSRLLDESKEAKEDRRAQRELLQQILRGLDGR